MTIIKYKETSFFNILDQLVNDILNIFLVVSKQYKIV